MFKWTNFLSHVPCSKSNENSVHIDFFFLDIKVLWKLESTFDKILDGLPLKEKRAQKITMELFSNTHYPVVACKKRHSSLEQADNMR